jgi:large subunit ribosomal protein L24
VLRGKVPERRRWSVRRNDMVEVIAGKDRGRRGKVLRVDRAAGRVVVEGVNVARKHQRPTPKLLQGGIVEQENPIAASAVMVVCQSCRKPTRVGHRILEDGRKVRKCVRCGEPLDR